MKNNRIAQWFARMSDRERKLVVGGGLLVAAALVAVAGTVVSRKVASLEERVQINDEALADVVELAPAYLDNRREEKAIDEQLTRASNTNLQSLLLGIAKDVKFTRAYSAEGGTTEARLSDFVIFANATEVLADLTKTGKRGRKRKRKKKKKKGKDKREVFLATIEVSFKQVPDTALFQFMAAVERHPEALFATSVHISRKSPNHQQFGAKLRIGQFKYGREGES